MQIMKKINKSQRCKNLTRVQIKEILMSLKLLKITIFYKIYLSVYIFFICYLQFGILRHMPFSISYDLFIRTKKQKLSNIISFSQSLKRISHQKMPISKSQFQSIIQPPSLSIQLNNFDFTKKSQPSIKIRPENNPLFQQINQKSLRKQSIEENASLKQSNINFGINYMQIQKSQSDQQQCHEKNIQMQDQIKQNLDIHLKDMHNNFKISISGPLQEVQNRLRSKAKSDDTIVKSNNQKNKNLSNSSMMDNPQKLFYSDKTNKKLKIDRFKQFFQFLLDFKLMKVQSYHPILHKIQIRKTLKSINQQQMKKKIQQKLRESHANKLTHSMNLQQNIKNINKKDSSKLHESLELSYKLTRSINTNSITLLNSQKQTNKGKQLQNSVVSLKISNLQMQEQNKLNNTNSEQVQVQSRDSSLLCYKIAEKAQTKQNNSQKNLFTFIPTNLNQKNLFKSQNLSDRSFIQKTTTKLVSYEDLKAKISNARAQTIHQGYYCNQCYVQPIVGNRYKCIQCQDYDLCEKCYQNQCFSYQRYEKNNPSANKIANNQESIAVFRNLRRSKSRMKQNVLLKKSFSQIQQEEEQNDSSSLKSDIKERSSQNQSSQHIHIMQIVLVSPLQNQLLKLSKVLRQTNIANQIRMSHISKSQKTIPFHENLQNFIQEQKLQNHIMKNSQKPLKSVKSYREDLNSIYQKIQKIKQLKTLSQTCKQTLLKK